MDTILAINASGFKMPRLDAYRRFGGSRVDFTGGKESAPHNFSLCVLGVGHGHFKISQKRMGWRQASIGQERPDIHIALYLEFGSIGADGSKSLELIKHQDARCPRWCRIGR